MMTCFWQHLYLQQRFSWLFLSPQSLFGLEDVKEIEESGLCISIYGNMDSKLDTYNTKFSTPDLNEAGLDASITYSPDYTLYYTVLVLFGIGVKI